MREQGGRGAAGDDGRTGFWRPAPDFGIDLKPGCIGHRHVQQDDVRLVHLRGDNGIHPVVCRGNNFESAMRLQHLDHAPHSKIMIVGNDNLHRHRRSPGWDVNC